MVRKLKFTVVIGVFSLNGITATRTQVLDALGNMGESFRRTGETFRDIRNDSLRQVDDSIETEIQKIELEEKRIRLQKLKEEEIIRKYKADQLRRKFKELAQSDSTDAGALDSASK